MSYKSVRESFEKGYSSLLKLREKGLFFQGTVRDKVVTFLLSDKHESRNSINPI